MKTLTILGQPWRLLYVSGLRDCGECNCATQVIRIRKGMSKAMTFRTLCHELVHAAGLGEEASEHAELLAGILVENGLNLHP